jgi:hypothetical protein
VSIDVTEVYVIPPGAVALLGPDEHVCWADGCDYVADPYFSSNLRMNLWSCPVLVTDDVNQFDTEPGQFYVQGDSRPFPQRLDITADQVNWVVLCGAPDWDNDGGWTPAHPNDPEPGRYNGNGCTDRWHKVPTVPLQFEEDD